MTSLTAGSPTCNCKNPDTCIHSFTLKVKDRTFTYKQDKFISRVEALDEGSKGVPLSLSLQDKQCVSHNPQCPQGVIYDQAKPDSLKSFNKGLTTYKARFDAENIRFFDHHDAIDFLVDYILAKDVRNKLPKASYILRVGQCSGEPFVGKRLNFADGMSQMLNLAPRDALWTYINIYPEFKWEIGASIGVAEEVTQFSDKELRKQQRTENANNGLPQRGHRGWTKRPPYEITDSLEMEGKLTAKVGNVSHEYSQKLKQDFKKKAKKINLLNRSVQSIDLLTKALSTTKSAGGKVKLLSTEIIYPKLEIKGSGELKEEASSENLYIENQVSLGFAPLMGMKITLDLLQAFAAWYRADVLLAAIREGLMSGEEENKAGKNSAFVGIKFELVAQGELNFTLAFKSDAKKNWEWQKVDSAEAKFSLTIEANVRAGVRFYIAEGALDVGGKAIAEGCFGLDNSVKDKLDLVFYHNGIVAKVYVSYTVGLSSQSERTGDGGGIPTSAEQTVDTSEKVEKEWTIHDKLEKKDSKYRINLI